MDPGQIAGLLVASYLVSRAKLTNTVINFNCSDWRSLSVSLQTALLPFCFFFLLPPSAGVDFRYDKPNDSAVCPGIPARHSWLRVFTPNCWKCRVANILSPSQGRSISEQQQRKKVYINKYTGTGEYIKMYIYYKQIENKNQINLGIQFRLTN